MWRWLPDADPTTPEVYTDMSGMYPTSDGGYAVIPVVANDATLLSGTDTQSAAPYGGFVRYLNGSVKLIWNTVSGVYENSTDVTGTAATMRSVAMYGNVCIITQGRSLNVKAKTGTGGTFADLAGSPPDSDFIVSNNRVVMLLSYNDGTDTPDGWWASDVGAHTTWTPGSANQAANGRLLDTPGPITGGILFKGDIYAFKENGIYVGRYVGRPVIWQWQLLRGDIGAPNQEAVLTDGNYLYFLGKTGAYRFDGYNFQRIDDGVWGGAAQLPQSKGICGDLQFALISTSGKLFGFYDETTGCCVWWARYNLGTVGGWAYNTKTGAWGLTSLLIGVTAGPNPAGVPWPMSREMIISSGISAVTDYDLPAWVVFGDDENLYAMNTVNSAAAVKISAYVTSGKIGNYEGMTEVKRITPLIATNRLSGDPDDVVDATLTMTPYTADNAVEVMTAGSAVSSSTELKRFDYMKTARFHAFKIANATHDWKIMGLIVKSRYSGTD